MTDSGMRTNALKSRFLQIHSSHDVHSDSKDHNPANFEISMPNSTVSNGVVRVVPHTVSIPRAFSNVYAPSNRMYIWRRKSRVIDLGTPELPNEWLVTGEANWTKTEVVVPPGNYTPVTLIYAMVDAGMFEAGVNMSYEPGGINRRFSVFNIASSYWEWGRISQPESPPSPPPYMPYIFLTEPEGSHFFDILGLGAAHFTPTATSYLSYSFDPNNPSSADSIRGSEIETAKIIVPLFRTDAHDIGSQLYYDYTIPSTMMNPANLEGPVNVSVVIEGLGDNASVDAETGKPADIITQVPMSSAWYTYSTRKVKDCDAEAVQYQGERTLRGFRVSLQDADGVTLRLPRNWPVHLRLQLLQTQ